MYCPKCGSERVYQVFTVYIKAPVDAIHWRGMTKKALNAKGVKIIGVNWDRAPDTTYCENCGWNVRTDTTTGSASSANELAIS
jgi:predicted RNA-binding Zn-ribbon protein involved in translation (DUF1610 family)